MYSLGATHRIPILLTTKTAHMSIDDRRYDEKPKITKKSTLDHYAGNSLKPVYFPIPIPSCNVKRSQLPSELKLTTTTTPFIEP